jgi:hypothetical protein
VLGIPETDPRQGTFWGANHTFGFGSADEGWRVKYRDALAAEGIHTYFVPAFSNSHSSPSAFFHDYPVVDGIMNWESWPWDHRPVSWEADLAYIKGARATGKTFMMSKLAPALAPYR